jgi:hypothetical protein
MAMPVFATVCKQADSPGNSRLGLIMSGQIFYRSG